jgi:arylsulfatase A-like enzyme
MTQAESERQSRRDFLRTLGLGTSALALGSWKFGEIPQRTPNIVIILTDDQGYGDVGKFGALGFTTPNLDRMASEGVMFTDFYVSEAVCSASRAALLTGCYSERVGIHGALMPGSPIGLNPEEETIADVLKKRGYATGIFGKWHLGNYVEFLPLQQGFDEYFGLPYSNDMWPVDYDGHPIDAGRKSRYPPLPLIEGNEKYAEIRTLEDQSTLTTRYTERAVRFIERNATRPFFLYVPHSMPHVPLGVSAKFRGKSRQGMYGDVIMEIDWSVGEILTAISKAGLDNDTLVIFVSDNGPWLIFGNHAGSAGPLREGKGTMWDGGARVPCIMRWPGHTAPGTVCRNLATTIDILPTIAAVCGAALPEKRIDGVNILPLLEGEKNANPRDHFFFYYDGELQAVREGRWKLHFPHAYVSMEGVTPGRDGHPGVYGKGRTDFALYDLETDIGERIDVFAEHPDIVAHLKALGNEARQDLGDTITRIKGRGVRSPGRAGDERSGVVQTLARGKTISLANPYSPHYPGSGGDALIDGKRGSFDHSDGAWQGYEGVDLIARIDLGRSASVRRITVSFLENEAVWIFLPRSVEIAVSGDGASFVTVKRFQTEQGDTFSPPRVQEFTTEVSTSAPVRYIKVSGQTIGVCPPWHPGAGNKAWLFADEIVVE